MNENERRHYQRIPYIAEVLLSQAGQEWSCGLEDISLKGVLIDAPEGVTAHLSDTYAIKLVLAEDVTINMNALVSHVTDTHWGMQWENIELEGLTHLRRLLELHMDDPEEMHRELAELG